ncbi:MAG TPA: hypothetical protein VNC78_01920 [Actinomycetota bacterium]|nr:hypothetical protein [Actinomycetota bacterium]
MTKTLRALLAVTLLITFAACGSDEPETGAQPQPEQPSPETNVLTIVERDYSFEVSGEIEAGTVSVSVSNEGSEFHEIAMARFLEGKTMDDLLKAIEKSKGRGNPLKGIAEEESVIDQLGSVQLPGTSFTSTGTGVEAGDYALLCFIPTKKGKSHYTLGMVSSFTVAEGDVAESPSADATYTATDDTLEGPETLPAGSTVIEVVNNTEVDREIFLVKIAAGKTVDDATKWFESAQGGPPDPATAPLEFFTFMFSGEGDRFLEVELTPGQWAIQTADPDKPFEGPPDKDPHAVLFTVE